MDWYLMQLSDTVYRCAPAKRKKKYKLEHWKILFNKEKSSPPAGMTKERAAQLSKAKWIRFVSNSPGRSGKPIPVKVVKAPSPSLARSPSSPSRPKLEDPPEG
jgi:hypothetical protein